MPRKISDCQQWIELSSTAVRHNLSVLRARCPGPTAIAALLKANAYGHGLLPMAEAFATAGLKIFMVHTLEEAEMLHHAGHTRQRILIIGPLRGAQFETAVRRGYEFFVYTMEALDTLQALPRKVKGKAAIHLKIETGTHRQGLLPAEIPEFARRLKSLPRVVIKGISTHFANIEETGDRRYYRTQLRRFHQAEAAFHKEGVDPGTRHTACSAAVLLYPETVLDMVRPGIALYGYFPSAEVAYALSDVHLCPVLSWRTRLCQVKTVPKGQPIGYGCTYVTTRRTRLGILPIGYYDGYDRKLSNIGTCLIQERRARVLGRVCMNLTMIDVTDIPDAKPGDTVTLLGCEGSEAVTADHLAAQTQTISYEILACLNPLTPRFLTD